jgi:hypothetical protein
MYQNKVIFLLEEINPKHLSTFEPGYFPAGKKQTIYEGFRASVDFILLRKVLVVVYSSWYNLINKPVFTGGKL